MGFSVKRADHEALCWEWFNVTSPGKALQESCQLSYCTDTTPLGKEWIYWKFETDVSARMFFPGPAWYSQSHVVDEHLRRLGTLVALLGRGQCPVESAIGINALLESGSPNPASCETSAGFQPSLVGPER